MNPFHVQRLGLLVQCNKIKVGSLNRFALKCLSSFQQQQQYHDNQRSSEKTKHSIMVFLASLVTSGCFGISWLMFNQKNNRSVLPQEIQEVRPLIIEPLERKKNKQSSSPGELRFQRFASVEVDGESFMTPADFLDSVVQDGPRPRIKSKVLLHKDQIKLLKNTPIINDFVLKHRSADPNFLRSLGPRGFISYPEYLFLLSIISKTKAAIRVAFDLIDTSFENQIEKEEYSNFVIFAAKAQKKYRAAKIDKEDTSRIDTTLSTHFFGLDGKHKLSFDEFEAFTAGIQREVLRAEFLEFSRGMEIISELDFARIILRYVDISEQEEELYFDLLDKHLPPEDERPGLVYYQVEEFFSLLNHISDFSFAFQLFSRVGHPLSKSEFARAAKISMKGKALDPYVIDVLFALFDKANDNCLSYEEFFVVMKNRLHRQVRKSLKRQGWEAFKQCVREERIKQAIKPI